LGLAFNLLQKCLIRYRYPASLPEEVAESLGICASNCWTFQRFVEALTSPSCSPTKLHKFMSRDQAEKAFKNALRMEKFPTNTLCSFYFSEGWLEFVLSFDEKGRLRRLYLQHSCLNSQQGVEIPLGTATPF